MLSGKELKEYREIRGLSQRDVESCCEISFQHISQIETGAKSITEYNHAEFVNGINRAYFAKCNGTFHRDPVVKWKPKVDELQADKPVVKTATNKKSNQQRGSVTNA